MKKLILFDIDGTILNFKSYRSREIFKETIYELFGVMLDEKLLPSFSGMTDLQILKEIAFHNNISYKSIEDRINEIWDYIFQKFIPHTTKENLLLLPGVKEILFNLSQDNNFQLGLLTGNFKENAYLKLSVFRLEHYFPFGAFGSDYADRNMLPDLAISRANEFVGKNYFAHSNTIIIGDSPKDIECAKENNIPVLCVTTGIHSRSELDFYKPDFIVDDLSDTMNIEDIIKNTKLRSRRQE